MNTKGLQGYLLFAILGVFVACMIWGQSKIEVDVKAYQDKIDKLEKKVDSLHAENTHLEIESDSLLQEISDYDNKIKNLNIKINVIQKETKAKLDAINSYSTSELQQFFTERYGSGFIQDSIN